MAETKAPRTPPRWLNALMILLLRTPGLGRLFGRGTALVTVTGRRTGRTYTTPVTYARRDGIAILTSHRTRKWWRNVEDRPRVVLRLAGRDYAGTASVHGDPAAALADLVHYLEANRSVARGMGAALDDEGKADITAARGLLENTVVITVTLDEESN